MKSAPLPPEGMFDDIRIDTLADLNLFSPDNVTRTEVDDSYISMAGKGAVRALKEVVPQVVSEKGSGSIVKKVGPASPQKDGEISEERRVFEVTAPAIDDVALVKEAQDVVDDADASEGAVLLREGGGPEVKEIGSDIQVVQGAGGF